MLILFERTRRVLVAFLVRCAVRAQTRDTQRASESERKESSVEAAGWSVAHVVGSGEGKAHEGALLKRGYGLPAEGGPNEKTNNQTKGLANERN